MPVTYSEPWASSLHGWVDLSTGGNSVSLNIDGNPADCIELITTGTGAIAEAASGPTTDTWETLGVTPGDTVATAQLSGLDGKTISGPGAATITVDIVDASGVSVLAAPIGSLSLTGWTGGWTTRAGTTQNVIAGKQASNTPVRVIIKGQGSAAIQFRVDNPTIVISPPAAVAKTGAEVGAGSDAGTVAAQAAAAESASVSDAAAITAPVAAADAASAADAGSVGITVPISASDTGSGTEAASPAVSVVASESGVAVDAVPGGALSAQVAAADAASASDASSLSTTGPPEELYMLYSDDDGMTWSVPVAMIPGGKHGTIQASADGRIILAAFSAGNILARLRQPGDADFGSIFTFLDSGGAPLSVNNDTFHLAPALEGPDRWFLACNIQGEFAVSLWVSADSGSTWTRATTLTIPSGVKPIAACFRDGTILFAGVIGNRIDARVRRSGDVDFGAKFTFVDDSTPAVTLHVEDDTFGVVECYEGPNRWILCVRFQGDDFTSEWTTSDRGASWKRVSNS